MVILQEKCLEQVETNAIVHLDTCEGKKGDE